MIKALLDWFLYYMEVKSVEGVTWRRLAKYCWKTRHVDVIKYHEDPHYLAEDIRGYCDWPAWPTQEAWWQGERINLEEFA